MDGKSDGWYPALMAYRIIRCSADYGLVIAVTPVDATPDIKDAQYYRCASWEIGNEPPDQFHEISFFSAMGYFSGHADGLGYGMEPHDNNFASLEDVLAYRNAQRSKRRSLLKETPSSRFFLLLREAQTASQAVDDFDLDFNNPESATLYRELMTEHRRTATALIRHCERFGEAVLKELDLEAKEDATEAKGYPEG